MFEKSPHITTLTQQMQRAEEAVLHSVEASEHFSDFEIEDSPADDATFNAYSNLRSAKLTALAAALQESIDSQINFVEKRKLTDKLHAIQREIGKRIAG